MNIFDKKLRKYNKIVYNSLKKSDFTSVCYSLEWFTTCYIISNSNISSYIIDLLLIHTNDILIRIGLAIMMTLESKIISIIEPEELHLKFKQWVMNDINPIDIITKALKIDLGITSILDIMYYNIDKMSPNGELIDTFRSKVGVESTVTTTTTITTDSQGKFDLKPYLLDELISKSRPYSFT
jgi:hypothetical protein